MIKFKPHGPSGALVIQRLADELNIQPLGKTYLVPEGIGKGFLWIENLPCGITVMVSDSLMSHDFAYNCEIAPSFNYCLQFNDARADVVADKKNYPARSILNVQTSVKISNAFDPVLFHLPQAVKFQSVKIFFNKEHLVKLLGKPEIEYLVSQYFDLLIQSDVVEPIDTGYRITLNDLLLGNINQPLRLNYIQNRTLLLIEKFILKFQGKKDLLNGKLKNTEDEVSRLMRIEALLVKDFKISRPTITELSKISAMSATKLKMDFKSLYGLPIFEYYQKNRMLRAKALLALSKYSIKEVGIMIGYSNLSHFANSFKKEFGHLPSERLSKDSKVVYNI